MKGKRLACPPACHNHPQTPLPSLTGYLPMEQSPIHLSLLTLFIKEDRPEAATDPRYREERGRQLRLPRQTPDLGLKQNETGSLWSEQTAQGGGDGGGGAVVAVARGRVRATELTLENGVGTWGAGVGSVLRR